MAIVKKIKKAVNGMVDTVGKAVYAKDVNSIAKDLQMKKKSIDSKKAELKSNFDKSQSKLKESFLAEKNKLPKDKMKSGGMLKRADGSMSKRGLWSSEGSKILSWGFLDMFLRFPRVSYEIHTAFLEVS